jgi:PAS domain-containing protein
MFITPKDDGVIPYVLTQILDACVNGVTLSDPDLPDSPLVYVNRVFEEMTGYGRDECIGRNCRFLQGEDRDQEALPVMRAAIARHESCVVTLRNYRKKQKVIYYLGIQYDLGRPPAGAGEGAADVALDLGRS